jgi:hypothetical protein
VSDRWVGAGAWLIRATGLLDRAYIRFTTVRSALVLALAPDAFLSRYGELAYGRIPRYRTDAPAFRRDLHWWEEEAFARFFPAPPGRILIGGAGGGREAFALAERGYEVVAFEPSPQLVETFAASMPSGCRMAVYRAGYEDLPTLAPAEPGHPPGDLREMRPFSAGVMGWSSFTHVLTAQQRLQALLAFAQATAGPVLISFEVDWPRMSRRGTPGWRDRLQPFLPGRPLVPGDIFTPDTGFRHQFTEQEIRVLFRAAGMRVLHLDLTSGCDIEAFSPHAVVTSSSG